MRDLASIEINVLVRELRDAIGGGRFKNFYELGEGSFLIAVAKDGNERDIYVRLNKAINETSFKEQAGEPTQFTLNLRKRLDRCTVSKVEQYGLDRVVIMGFEHAGEEKTLVIEMFGKGNMLLVNKEGIAELVYKNLSYKGREQHRNMLYSFPKGGSLGPEEIKADRLEAAMKEIAESEDKLIAALGRYVNFGPLYLEEIIANSALDANARACDQGVLSSRLSREVVSMYEKSKSPAPRIYVDKDKGAFRDFAIVPISKYEKDTGLKTEETVTLGELLDRLYLSERSSGVDPKKAREIEELNASIEKQKAQISETKESSKTYADFANKIFEHMRDINALAEQARKAKAKSAADITGKIGSVRVKSLDPKNKTLKIEVND